jgi:hypothetical protein
MSATYQDLIDEFAITNLTQLNELFENKLVDEWISNYCEDSLGLFGDITVQRFFDFTFIFDYTGNPQNDGIEACAIPDARVIGVFGLSNQNINTSNRAMMKRFRGKPGAYDVLGGKYDRGHFIAHLSGGPIDINLFPQRRDVNRGSGIGKKYRAMERHIAKNPGLFVFSKPVYHDFSCCPFEIQFGYCDESLNFTVEKFPNRY